MRGILNGTFWRGVFLCLILGGVSAFALPSFSSAQAQIQKRLGATGLPLPRFVSLKATAANVRVGPGAEYDILWQFRRRGLPIEIIAEYKLWRQIRDYDGAQGWIHASLLRGQRGVILKKNKRRNEAHPLRAAPKSHARILALLQSGVIAQLETCQNNWCEIEAGAYHGWVQRTRIWGVYDSEFQN